MRSLRLAITFAILTTLVAPTVSTASPAAASGPLASGEGEGAGWVSVALALSGGTAEVTLASVGAAENRTVVKGAAILSPEGAVEMMFASFVIRDPGSIAFGWTSTGSSRWYRGYYGADGGITLPLTGYGQVIAVLWTPGDATRYTWSVHGEGAVTLVNATHGTADLPYATDARNVEAAPAVSSPTGEAQVRRSTLHAKAEHRLFAYWWNAPDDAHPCAEAADRWMCAHSGIATSASDWSGPSREDVVLTDSWMRGTPAGDYTFRRDDVVPGDHCVGTTCAGVRSSAGEFFLSGADVRVASFG